LSRADTWVLAAMTALQQQQVTTAVPFDMQFVGRKVCNGAANRGPDRQMPKAHAFTRELLDYFGTTFGFNARETVAIMGGHTLGVAVQENSGFTGEDGWVTRPERLDNQFYRALIQFGEVSPYFISLEVDNSAIDYYPNQYLWRQGSAQQFMLNADMAIVSDFEGSIDPVSGAVSCGRPSNCPKSPTFSIAEEYANNNSLWVNEFHDAFLKMTRTGCDSTKCYQL